jgi:hypothetical protein
LCFGYQLVELSNSTMVGVGGFLATFFEDFTHIE